MEAMDLAKKIIESKEAIHITTDEAAKIKDCCFNSSSLGNVIVSFVYDKL
jgi:hypothetical protein